MIKIIEAWKNTRRALIGIAVVFIILLWPAIPLKGLDVWFKTLAGISYTIFLYPVMALLTGSFVVLYIYNRQCKTCKTNPTSGASASIFGALLGACPACIPALAFFLPLGVTVTLSYFSWIFLLASIFILTFILYRMEGLKEFQKQQYKKSLDSTIIVDKKEDKWQIGLF